MIICCSVLALETFCWTRIINDDVAGLRESWKKENCYAVLFCCTGVHLHDPAAHYTCQPQFQAISVQAPETVDTTIAKTTPTLAVLASNQMKEQNCDT